MNITTIRKKKQNKKEEFEDIKKEYKSVTRKQWLRFSLAVMLFVLILLFIGLLISNNQDDNNFIVNDSVSADCFLSNNCLDSCLNYYEGDGVNHSLECNYKCLTYKNCFDG